MTSRDLPRLLTIPEAADELRMHHDTLYRLAKARKIQTVRRGSRVFIERDALDKWVAAHTHRSVTR